MFCQHLLKSISSLLLLFSLSGVTAAQQLLPTGISSKEFPNGLRAIVIPTETEDVVALHILMRVGSRNEVEEGKSGFAHFFEHLMFRGTTRYPADKAQAMLKKAGVSSNAWTWDDQTVYHKVFLKEDLERILDYEADRFQNLKYAEPEFRTEALAVLGEYNKNSANPTEKMFEVMQDTAFNTHTYKHTTMGFLRDIEQYPEGYDYSWQFFQRFYRPEYATIVLVGDIRSEDAFASIQRHFGSWERGNYKPVIPQEQPQKAPKKAHIDWDSPTLPWVMVGYKAPPYSELRKTAALQLWEALSFSKTGKLYQELVVEEQLVDEFQPFFWLKKDPFLVGLAVRVTDKEKLPEVRRRITDYFQNSATRPIEDSELQAVKSRMRYSFLHQLDSPASIASSLSILLSLDPDPQSVERYYQSLNEVQVKDLRAVAESVFHPRGRTVVTLSTKESKS